MNPLRTNRYASTAGPQTALEGRNLNARLARIFVSTLLSLFHLAGISLPTSAKAADSEDKVATDIADSWLGHDASELLTQWPIDKGYMTYELDKTNETAYSFYFGVDAYSYSHDVFDGQQMVAPGVIEQSYHQEIVNVPRQDHCFITFFANAEGIIARYQYSGVKCRPYLKNWGRPKNK